MRRSNRGIPRIAVILVGILPLISSCRRDPNDAKLARTLIALRDLTTNCGSMQEHEVQAYRSAIPPLEKNGAGALPMMLTATIAHGLDVPQNVTGWNYGFEWLDLGGSVKGFYFRSEGRPDVDTYPALNKKPQVRDTAWMVQSAPILLSEKQRSLVRESDAEFVVLLDAGLLAQKTLQAGLILADGRKSVPVDVFIKECDEEKDRNKDP